ncbi:hypothetical protein [Acidovorax sp. CCYZU-2555]|uniref:hypothetical protein n=1 Tax=Acidovorax sp. CCYZU-2555 TaxID=2835042 RepID=UPI001BCBDF97|nr:hypothetical protein [Acidovorax sp. CCYZU-2555]MBS7777413.1 hypothetical protein [Acidovorax sp. CCYZU-2555]
MSVITNLLKVGAGLLSIPFQPLLAINAVNSLVNKMTGGYVNRDILARNFFSGLWGLTVAHFNSGLGDHDAQQAPYRPRDF